MSKLSSDEGSIVLSVAQSRVQIEEDFKERLVQGIQADEDYAAIWQKLQDPTTNEVTERSRKYKIR